jgi:hypothetical protein
LTPLRRYQITHFFLHSVWRRFLMAIFTQNTFFLSFFLYSIFLGVHGFNKCTLWHSEEGRSGGD